MAWTIRTATRPPRERPYQLAGSEHLYDDVHARLWRDGAHWRIDVDDTATYDWDPEIREIVCAPRPNSSEDFVRGHLLGRVLATCLHDEGFLVLHGSAVTIGGGAVAFLAPKGSGKTTLAAMLVAAGAGLLTDDSLPVALDGVVQAFPGVHSLRMHADAMSMGGAVAGSEAREDGKFVVSAQGQVTQDPVPLRVVYLLGPVRWISGERPVARAPLTPPAALAALVGHTKGGAMLGTAAAPEQLKRSQTLCKQVPVERLLVVRDLPTLPEVVNQLLRWHGGT